MIKKYVRPSLRKPPGGRPRVSPEDPVVTLIPGPLREQFQASGMTAGQLLTRLEAEHGVRLSSASFSRILGGQQKTTRMSIASALQALFNSTRAITPADIGKHLPSLEGAAPAVINALANASLAWVVRIGKPVTKFEVLRIAEVLWERIVMWPTVWFVAKDGEAEARRQFAEENARDGWMRYGLPMLRAIELAAGIELMPAAGGERGDPKAKPGKQRGRRKPKK